MSTCTVVACVEDCDEIGNMCVGIENMFFCSGRGTAVVTVEKSGKKSVRIL